MKRINDYHGHAAGDQALQDTGALLRETFRASDLIARLGGDEFCVLELGNASVGSIARLQEAVVRFNAKSGRPYEIALSIGAADFNPSEPVDLDELIARADVSMYEDKRTRKSRPRVLVVDDSPADRRLAQLLFERDFDIVTAQSGSEALYLAKDQTPDVVLLDINLPDVNGAEVAQQLKAHLKTAHVPILMLTGVDDRALQARYLSQGIEDFVVKPFDAEVLKARINNLVDRRNTR